MRDIKEEMHFRSFNDTGDKISDDCIYLNEISDILRNLIDFSEYVQIDLNGDEVISRKLYHELLLLHVEDYRKYVANEVLTDIDKYGYYANENIEQAIMEVSGLVNSEFIDEFDDEMKEALYVLDDVSYKKYKKRTRKNNKRVDKWQNEK